MFSYADVVGQVARIHFPDRCQSITTDWDQNQHDSASIVGSPLESPDNQKLLSVVWNLISEGVLYPRLLQIRDGYPTKIETVCLTERGKRLVQEADAHPLHPGYLQKFQSASRLIPEDVVARLEDASQCLAQGLLRAAVVMVGLAMERTVLVTHGALVSLNLAQPYVRPVPNMRDILSDVRTGVNAWNGKSEPKQKLNMAVVAAENVRIERNKASHAGNVPFDQDTVEELLVSSARQIPTFWQIIIDEAVRTHGFTVP